MELSEVFRISVMCSFILAGTSKLFAIKEAKKFPEKIGLISGKYGQILGGSMPFIELFIGIFGIIFNSYILNILAIGVLLFFIVLNLKYTLEKKSSKCFCYGKLINTKIGIGGLSHYMYQIIIFIVSIIGLKHSINISSWIEFTNTVCLSLLLLANGIIIRRFIEKFTI